MIPRREQQLHRVAVDRDDMRIPQVVGTVLLAGVGVVMSYIRVLNLDKMNFSRSGHIL